MAEDVHLVSAELYGSRTLAVLQGVSGGYYKWFTAMWIVILASSWIAVRLAEITGVQIMSLLLAALGVLQVGAARRAILLRK